MYSKCTSSDTVTVTVNRVWRSSWFGHVVRMDDERAVERLAAGRQGGGRKKRKNWIKLDG